MQTASHHAPLPDSSHPALRWLHPGKIIPMNNNPWAAGSFDNWEIKDVVQLNAFDSCNFVGAVQAPRGVSGHLVMAGEPHCWSRKQTMPEGRTL
jgi:hypothetical protein